MDLFKNEEQNGGADTSVGLNYAGDDMNSDNSSKGS